ncbi:EthD family reductase [Nocardioides lentus]|uniref:EthD family reductase n=1 Tax=Nocardioides lentus TaxID=338077 RepID=A0ABN2PQZ0_9ACTN
MTFQLTVLYGRPADPAAFDAYYAETHVPLANGLSGLTSYTTFKPGPGPDGAEPDTYLVANLTFTDADAFGAAMGSDHGRRTVADVENFATGGATMLMGDGVTTHA